MAHQEGPEAASDAARQLLGDAPGESPETLRSKSAPGMSPDKAETPKPAMKPARAANGHKPRFTDWASI